MLKKSFSSIKIKNLFSHSYRSFGISSKFDPFQKEEENKKTFNNDPHKFNIYKKIRPDYGKQVEPQDIPEFIQKVRDPKIMDLEYWPVDLEPNFKKAVEENFPIITESVSSSYSLKVGDKKYHVFNAARYVSFFLYLKVNRKNLNKSSLSFTRKVFTFIHKKYLSM